MTRRPPPRPGPHRSWLGRIPDLQRTPTGPLRALRYRPLLDGQAVIQLPEHFCLVTATEGLTIHLTPHGEFLQLYVSELSTTRCVVREAQGRTGNFYYLIQGVRKGQENYSVVRTKQVPTLPPRQQAATPNPNSH
jgi:hypothetical protein